MPLQAPARPIGLDGRDEAKSINGKDADLLALHANKGTVCQLGTGDEEILTPFTKLALQKTFILDPRRDTGGQLGYTTSTVD